MDTVKEKIRRWKDTAGIFLKEGTRAFIKDLSGNLYFCKIIIVEEDSFQIECFGPSQRKAQKFTLYWNLISDFQAYQEKL